MIPLSSLVIWVFAYLGPLGWLERKKHLVQYKFHGNERYSMFYPYNYTDSNRLVNVAQWE